VLARQRSAVPRPGQLEGAIPGDWLTGSGTGSDLTQGLNQWNAEVCAGQGD